MDKTMIKAIFDKVIIPESFGGNIDEEDYTNVDEWSWGLLNKEQIMEETEYAHGVSKLVFIFNNLDSVIKIPFNGYWSSIWDHEEGCYKDEDEWNDFYTSDYCDKELCKYIAAKEKGLEMFFAGTELFTFSKNRRPIYVQEKVVPFYEFKRRTFSEKTVKAARTLRLEYYTRLETEWICAAIRYYGIELTRKFLNFIENEDHEIGLDLHTGNYGFRADGTPVLLDYSGWSEDL